MTDPNDLPQPDPLDLARFGDDGGRPADPDE
jgi:hypothetical protein